MNKIFVVAIAIVALSFAVPDCKFFFFVVVKHSFFNLFQTIFFFHQGSYEPALPVIPGCDFLGYVSFDHS